jgi:hypothetical protein
MTEHKAGRGAGRRRIRARSSGASSTALDLTVYAAAPLIGVTRMALGNVIAGKSAVSPDMALRLGKFFDNGQRSGWGCRPMSTSGTRAPG